MKSALDVLKHLYCNRLFVVIFTILFSQTAYSQSSPRWKYTDSLPVPSFGKSVTLANGNILLHLKDKTTMIYNSNEERWYPTDSLKYNHYEPELISLNDGSVLLVGAEVSSSVKSFEIFNPVTWKWTDTGSTLICHTSRFTLTKLLDGRILLAGGQMRPAGSITSKGTSFCEIYNPHTKTWSATDTLHFVRSGHSAILLNDGRVLVTGGTGAAYGEIYDPQTNNWQLTATYSLNFSSNYLLKLKTGKVAKFSGRGVELYDIQANSWQAVNTENIYGANFRMDLLENDNILLFTRINNRVVAQELRVNSFLPLYTDTLELEYLSINPNLVGAKVSTLFHKLPSQQYLTAGGEIIYNPSGFPGVGLTNRCQIYTPSFITKAEKVVPNSNRVSVSQYPNPFTGTTAVNYSLPREEFVTIEVFNTLGEKITTITEGYKPAGEHKVTLNLPGVSKGVYLCRIQAGGVVKTIKMLCSGLVQE